MLPLAEPLRARSGGGWQGHHLSASGSERSLSDTAARPGTALLPRQPSARSRSIPVTLPAIDHAAALLAAARAEWAGRRRVWEASLAEVARLVASGATNREIAETSVIAPKTVATHVEHILSKLEMSRRAVVAAWVATTLH